MELKATTMSTEMAVAIQRTFIGKVYRWMFVGLLVTACVAYGVVSSPALTQTLLSSRGLYLGLIGGELLLVMALAGMVQRLSPAVAGALFFGYAALNGVTLSVVLLAYTSTSVSQAFFVSAGLFGVMSAYGSTGRDLSSWRSFLFMGLLGVVIASVVNLFLHSSAMGFVLSCASVVVFTGLTAYDTNKLRGMALALEGPEQEGRMAIVGALSLYLDFVNLFLSLLRLFGKRR